MTEQVYFGISEDGFHWQALNDTEPILVSQIGEHGVRDPFLLRLQDRKRFVLLATDLSIHLNPSWERAVRAGSKSLVIWESEDLVHWSEPRLVEVAPRDAGCTWAPEVIYDKDTDDYLVFWASTTARDDYSRHRIWASRTVDFKTFDEPFIYIDKSHAVIDTDIVSDGEKYYRFSKDEKVKTITMETSKHLLGPWEEMPQFSLASLTGYEGPQCFALGEGRWCLLLDYFSRNEGYKAFVTRDLAGGQFEATDNFSSPFHFRHGSVLPISAEEYARLRTPLAKQG